MGQMRFLCFRYLTASRECKCLEYDLPVTDANCSLVPLLICLSLFISFLDSIINDEMKFVVIENVCFAFFESLISVFQYSYIEDIKSEIRFPVENWD